MSGWRQLCPVMRILFPSPIVYVVSNGRSSGVSCVVEHLLHEKLFDTLRGELVCKLEWHAWINVF